MTCMKTPIPNIQPIYVQYLRNMYKNINSMLENRSDDISIKILSVGQKKLIRFVCIYVYICM